MRSAQSWAAAVRPAAHLGEPGELERQIKRIQADALLESAKIAQSCIDGSYHPYYHSAAQMVIFAILAKARELE